MRGPTSEFYKQLSPQDRIVFDRWLKANVVIASIFSTALFAMAFFGTPFSESIDASAAHIKTASISSFHASDGAFGQKVHRKPRQYRSQGDQ
jgi:hypothetical protein